MNRGDKEGFLTVSIQVDADPLTGYLTRQMVTRPDSPAAEQVSTACTDAYGRLISPSIEREIRSALTERAEESAIKVFSKNLRGLLLQPPVKGHVCPVSYTHLDVYKRQMQAANRTAKNLLQQIKFILMDPSRYIFLKYGQCSFQISLFIYIVSPYTNLSPFFT